jgi:hypothetical protein
MEDVFTVYGKSPTVAGERWNEARIVEESRFAEKNALMPTLVETLIAPSEGYALRSLNA